MNTRLSLLGVHESYTIEVRKFIYSTHYTVNRKVLSLLSF